MSEWVWNRTPEKSCPSRITTGHIGSNRPEKHLGGFVRSPTHDSEFRRTYDEHFEAIRRYCLRRLPLADANDAVSDVFLVAWRRRDAIPEEALPWLYGVARNAVRNIERQRRRSNRISARANVEPSYPAPGADVIVVRNEDDERLMAALSSLGDQDREILMLRAWEGMTAAQIAVSNDISVSAAEKRIARATKRLESSMNKRRTGGSGREAASEQPLA
jgi:RNA polymerase sigma-70 factor (ECF subfamily)